MRACISRLGIIYLTPHRIDVDTAGVPESRDAGAPEVLTERMLEAGVLALAHIRKPLADDEISLREAVREVYLAVRQASEARPIHVVETGYRRLFGSSVHAGMFLKRSGRGYRV